MGARVNAPTVDAQSDEFGNVPYHSGYYLVDVSHEQVSYLVVLFLLMVVNEMEVLTMRTGRKSPNTGSIQHDQTGSSVKP